MYDWDKHHWLERKAQNSIHGQLSNETVINMYGFPRESLHTGALSSSIRLRLGWLPTKHTHERGFSSICWAENLVFILLHREDAALQVMFHLPTRCKSNPPKVIIILNNMYTEMPQGWKAGQHSSSRWKIGLRLPTAEHGADKMQPLEYSPRNLHQRRVDYWCVQVQARKTNNFTLSTLSSNLRWPVGPTYRCTNNRSHLKKLSKWKYPLSQQVCYEQRDQVSSSFMTWTVALQRRDIPSPRVNRPPQWNSGAASGGNRRKLKPRSRLCGSIWR